jgi:hypothetical protein
MRLRLPRFTERAAVNTAHDLTFPGWPVAATYRHERRTPPPRRLGKFYLRAKASDLAVRSLRRDRFGRDHTVLRIIWIEVRGVWEGAEAHKPYGRPRQADAHVVAAALWKRLRKIGSLPVKVTVPPPSLGLSPMSRMNSANAASIENWPLGGGGCRIGR